MTDFPRTTRALREALAERGLAPLKRHGQCFLTDVQAIDAIVRDAEVAPADAVVEIGTGSGCLTHALCEAGASIDTFDIDGGVQDLAKSLREWPDRVRFHNTDALDGKHSLSAPVLEALARGRAEATARGGLLRSVSNLPYNAATPVLLSMLALDDPPDSVTAMVQNEVAEKLLAAPGDEGYGSPSILRALLADGKILRRFPPQVFWPTPTVRSALLRLVPRRPRAIGRGEERPFGDFLLGLFSRRRKVLSTALRAPRPALSAAESAAACRSAGLDPGSRPEDAAPDSLLALFHRTESGDRRATS